MANAGNGLPLEAGGGGEQGPGRGEDNAFEAALPETGEKVAVEDACRAAAAAAACVHVLLFPVIEQKTAVLEILSRPKAALFQQVPEDGVAQGAQVPGEHQVVVGGGGLGVLKEGGEGVKGGGGRSQGCTMWKMFSVKFNAYSSPEARRF